MRLFDSHCHLEDKAFERDRKAVLSRAREAGVSCAMIAGSTLETSEAAAALAGSHSGLFASVGFHPHDAKACTEEAIAALTSLAGNPIVRAWGEIGLDFNRMYSPRDAQEKWFSRQIEAARRADLPIIFHERESGGRLIEIVRSHAPGLRGVVHCFSGTGPELAAYLELGLFIGITGIVTHGERGAALREMVRDIPRERILIETDAPYLTPTPERNRFRRNEPAFVRTVLLKLAEVRGEAPEKLAEASFRNACSLFRIGAEETGL
jgi:TatD DNase family protein